MANQLTWDYAQEYSSQIFAKVATILLCFNIPYIILTPFISQSAVLIIGCVILGMQALSLIVPVYFVERKLKIFFVKVSNI